MVDILFSAIYQKHFNKLSIVYKRCVGGIAYLVHNFCNTFAIFKFYFNFFKDYYSPGFLAF